MQTPVSATSTYLLKIKPHLRLLAPSFPNCEEKAMVAALLGSERRKTH